MSDPIYRTISAPTGGRRWRGGHTGGGGLFLLGAALALLTAPALAAEEIRGEANVVSGNEVIVGKRAVRLFGILAPGLDDQCKVDGVDMKCGIIAWAELIKLADGQLISCDREELPAEAAAVAKSEKPVIFATCYIGEMDVNEALVRSGWAQAVPEQTDRYEVDETDAKESHRGLWSSDRKRRR